jgi:endonuclease-3 related protein
MNKILKIYKLLYDEYKPQGWWPILMSNESEEYATLYHPNDFSYPKNRDQRFEISIGAILTQNTAWKNVEKALINLKKQDLLNCKGILRVNEEKLKELIRPSGYYNQKAERLKIFADWFSKLKNIPQRNELLSLKGIGPETADSILLYAFKIPSFVVDAYTKRIFYALKLIKKDSRYEEVKHLFEHNIPRDFKLYQEYHALLVEHAKRFYLKKKNRREDFLGNLIHY